MRRCRRFFLAAGVAVLSGAEGIPLACVLLVVLMCVLLTCAVAAALFALRPVVPHAGLRDELTGGAGGCRGGVAERDERPGVQVQERRLEILAQLADRKLRTVRVAVDLVLAALVVAGMCLLSGFAIG
ncbi:hypothetical protein IHE61_21600 [Streptomyces sp. GKU 257-1]|nr:hypothetical protein [Streptomyces sp. GKU 257-1]